VSPTATTEERRIEFGDWQTPSTLATEVMDLVRSRSSGFAAVLEPTCGYGTFLKAAGAIYPQAKLLGFDISPEYVLGAGAALARFDADVQVGDFFQINWARVLRLLVDPILILGNPPWVTNSALGTLNAANLPTKVSSPGVSGLDVMTGKSNFDISEWMIRHLLEEVEDRQFALAMLCKSSVARRIMELTAKQGWRLDGSVFAIDSRTHFNAAVDAVLLWIQSSSLSRPRSEPTRWGVYSSLQSESADNFMGVVDGRLCSDVDAFLRTRTLEGTSEIEWRSGLKHDCSRIMELQATESGLINGLQERVELEPDFVYPLLKGSDLANDRLEPRRHVIVTQCRLGDDTRQIRNTCPATWSYLEMHQAHLQARKSSIYRNQPDYAIFGIGDYSFAPYKVAICGLYKKLNFSVIGPRSGKPVMVDDTAYFLSFDSVEAATTVAAALNSARARAFFEARVFWDAKRPVNKALLQSLSLSKLLTAEFGTTAMLSGVKSRQQALEFN